MRDILKLVRIQVLVVVLFVLFKLSRSIFLQDTSPETLKIFLLSVPNLSEGIIGVLLLTGIGLYINIQLAIHLPEKVVYLIATVF